MNDTKKEQPLMGRRRFVQSLLGTSVAVMSGAAGAMAQPVTSGHAKTDLGEVRSVTVTCISETGWFDTPILGRDIQRSGGRHTNQYDIAYTEENLGGFSALLDVEALNGKHTLYLLDSGWSTAWMDHAFNKAGVDTLLGDGKIGALIVSHDHNDHFFGIESTLKHRQDITIYHPATIQENSLQLINGADFSRLPGCPRNRFPHTGTRIPTKFGNVYSPQKGMGVVAFDVSVPLGVRGENVVYINIKDKGHVVITGCGHPGVASILHYPAEHFAGGGRLYGCYGGLHIAPFEKWEPRMQESIDLMKQAGLQRIACNHCTGRVWGRKAVKAGLPIIQGTEEYRSYNKVAASCMSGHDTLYIGNGDMVSF